LRGRSERTGVGESGDEDAGGREAERQRGKEAKRQRGREKQIPHAAAEKNRRFNAEARRTLRNNSEQERI
jgi:hypothetical protein